MRLLATLLAFCLSFSLFAQEVIITGALDGDLFIDGVGGRPRAVELYVSGTLELGGYQLLLYSNASTSVQTTFTLPAGSYTDEFVYLVKPEDEQIFIDAFGTAGDFSNRITTSAVNGNGNDSYVLLNASGTVIDQTAGAIGSSTNVHADGYLYRNNNTGPDGGWIAGNWTGGNLSVDGLPITGYASTVPFGTYTRTPPGPSVSATANGDLTEPATNGGFTVTLTEVAAADVTVGYTLSGTATIGADYADANGGSVVITAGQLSAPINLTVLDDATYEPTETIVISLTSVSDPTFALGGGATVNVIDDEPVGTFFIHQVQGSGDVTPFSGQDVSIEGIVVGDFQGSTGVGLGGFFVQEEDADADADPLTSEGIWVYDNTGATAVAVGDKVTVTGRAEEISNLTQINVTVAGASVAIVSSGNTLPTPTSLDLPIAAMADYEAYEGMLTVLIDDAVVTETYNYGRFGEFLISESERLAQFTECNTPDAGAVAAYNTQLDLSSLIVDDGRSGDNNFPLILPDGTNFSASNTIRSGTVFTGLTGVLDQRFGDYRLQFTDFSGQIDNPRPTTAPAVGGVIQVVGMNVLNYFTTLNSRGANNAAEFDRQEAKIVAAICELDADILGLVEIERNGFGASSAIQTLIDAVQAGCGKTYDFVLNPNPGGDQIMVALIYDPSRVEESGTAANLTSTAGQFGSNRVPLAQTFRVIAPGSPNFGQQVTVCVNHWKSKGGSCPGDADDAAGAGCFNGTRVAAATAILDWLTNDDPTGTGITEQLIIGDLNAYSMEEPITTFTDAGWANTVRDNAGAGSFPCGSVPSYVFNGQWGSLDHGLASPSLAGKVTGATPWGVNAEEPTALDYDTQFNDPSLFAPDFYRFSDHNPIVIGLNLGQSLPVELLDFRGAAEDKNVKLRWETLTEQATERFSIERRNTAGDFAAIGSVAAVGNSNERVSYDFTDVAPQAGVNAYRLRMIDEDGSEAFSNIINVAFTEGPALQLQQLTSRHLRLKGAALQSSYLFTNAAGAVLRQGTATSEYVDIDGAGLPAGLYFLAVRTPAGATETIKVILP